MDKKKDKIIIFGTTLRDGEQAPCTTMILDQKLSIANALDEMKVDIIETGFPISSEGEFKAVNVISTKVNYFIVAGLARANKLIYGPQNIEIHRHDVEKDGSYLPIGITLDSQE